MVNKDDLLIFKMRAKGEKPAQEQPQPEPAPVQKEEIAQPVAQPAVQAKAEQQPAAQGRGATPERTRPQAPEGQAQGKKVYKNAFEEQQKDQAVGMYCEWHPWRPAFAVCNTCHRAFCYEDTSEYNNKYYCLEDIDSAAIRELPREAFGYSKLNLVSASAFILPVFVYVYFLNRSLLTTGATAINAGLFNFIQANFVSTFDVAYFTLIIGLIIVLLEFIAAILIFMQTKRGYLAGVVVGSLSFVFFTYVSPYNTHLPYLVLMGGLPLLGLVTLILSRRQRIWKENVQTVETTDVPQPMQYSNIGRF
ncbi:MAG TPA: hypothetical protein VL944_00390 [Candidatus Acidoferrum sp.]|nr:hypothetical protein [Candidatus Acidoferrum sp.]